MITHDIPQLAIELLDNGCLRLENTHCGETYAVDVHPCQLRLMAETMGLIPEVSASDADILRTERGRHAEIVRDQRRLRLALLAVRDRIEYLFKAMCAANDHGREDLSVEVAQTAALADIVDLACADFEGEFVNTDPEPTKPIVNPAKTQRVKPAVSTVSTVVDAVAPAAQPSLL